MITEETGIATRIPRHIAYCDGACGKTASAASREELREEMAVQGWYKTSFWGGHAYVTHHYCADCAAKLVPDQHTALYPIE